MTTFHISDTHFGHRNIITYCNRPFKNVDHMNAELVRRWNSIVEPEDTVYHYGDVALGKIDQSLPRVGELNGYIILVEGNHDRPFMDKNRANKREHWLMEYFQFFDEIHPHLYNVDIGPARVNMSHFPYDGDSHGEDRYATARIPDEGVTLIHGHTHSSGDPVSRSKRGTLQIHVGADAWDYTPVPNEVVARLISENM